MIVQQFSLFFAMTLFRRFSWVGNLWTILWRFFG